MPESMREAIGQVKELWDNNRWLIDVKRWECIPGCGVLTENNIYIGGDCDEFTENRHNDGTCNCNYEELFGDTCSLSCPGLLTKNNELLFYRLLCRLHC